MRTLLLTGATGFVGRAVYPALVAAGWSVRGLTRDAARARARFPAVAWVEGDLSDAAACARALEGCSAALYLVHGIGAGADYHAQEVHAAETFARAASAAQVGRLVYRAAWRRQERAARTCAAGARSARRSAEVRFRRWSCAPA